MRIRSRPLEYSDICHIIKKLEQDERTKCSDVFFKLLEKYSKKINETPEIERETFRSRLYEMARREIEPYGEEYITR